MQNVLWLSHNPCQFWYAQWKWPKWLKRNDNHSELRSRHCCHRAVNKCLWKVVPCGGDWELLYQIIFCTWFRFQHFTHSCGTCLLIFPSAPSKCLRIRYRFIILLQRCACILTLGTHIIYAVWCMIDCAISRFTKNDVHQNCLICLFLPFVYDFFA